MLREIESPSEDGDDEDETHLVNPATFYVRPSSQGITGSPFRSPNSDITCLGIDAHYVPVCVAKVQQKWLDINFAVLPRPACFIGFGV